MAATLFFCFLAIFVVTAGVTLAGMTGKLQVPEQYLKPLFRLLLLEVVGSVLLLFQSAEFFRNPLEEFLAELPPGLKATSKEGDTEQVAGETLENIKALVDREVELKKTTAVQAPFVAMFEQLPASVHDPNAGVALANIQRVLKERAESLSERDDLQVLLAEALTRLEAFEEQELGHDLSLADCRKLRDNPLVKLNTLGSKLGPLGKDTINLTYKAETKAEEARLILDVLVAIRQHVGSSELSPEDVKVALISYQGRAGLPSDGYFGPKTLERMFWDYLSNDADTKTPLPQEAVGS